MKRSFFGLGLLLCLLALSLTVTWGMDRIHRPVADALTAAEEKAQAGDWQGAVELEGIAKAGWDRWSELRKCFADHTPMEEIDAQFAMLASCIRSDRQEEFPMLAAQTAQMVKAMGDAHGLGLGAFF